MKNRSGSRLVEQLAGDGWLLCGGVRLGQVMYVINVHEIRTSLGARAISATEAHVRLLNHTVTVDDDRVLQLCLADGRTISGFLSLDGARLVRTGALT
jgi:hypothetical protein